MAPGLNGVMIPPHQSKRANIVIWLFLQYALPHHFLSRIVGFLASSQIRIIKSTGIRLFAKYYSVDMHEAERKMFTEYRSFNDFFTRELEPGARQPKGTLSCPADGLVSAAGPVIDLELTQIKEERYSLQALLATEDVEAYEQGSFITIYLAPSDYHRVHFPKDTQVKEAKYIPGRLFSVNTVTAENIPNLFVRNERLVVTMEDGYVLVMVGAMIVAGISTPWRPDGYPPGVRTTDHVNKQYYKGDELGRFYLGSTAILVSPNQEDWLVNSGDQVRFGDALT